MIWEWDPSCWSALMLQYWGSACWEMHLAQVPQCAAAVEMQVQLWGGRAQGKRLWTAVPCATKGPMASQVRDTQRWGRSWETQTFTYWDCKGIKPQGFLCSGSSSEAPAWAVTQLMQSRHLKLCYGKPGAEPVKKPCQTAREYGYGCKETSVLARGGETMTVRAAPRWSDRTLSLTFTLGHACKINMLFNILIPVLKKLWWHLLQLFFLFPFQDFF